MIMNKMIELPEKYKEEMKHLLKEEYEDYLNSFTCPSYHGLRVNTNKISVEDFLAKFPYHLEPVPWTSDGFYYNEEDPVTKHPYYYAGLYYVQEPSAMLPAETLPISLGDTVLDVCAAPGGKTTKLGVKLQDTGVLFANDLSVSRSQILLRNIEKFGLRNTFVMAEDSNRFKKNFPNTFDAILADVPCSGEGMFRKDHRLISSWMERDSQYFVPIQKEIVKNCLEMLKEGGYLVYSTCTFSPCEDEEVIQYALSLDDSLHVIPLKPVEGFVQNEFGTKLFPHRIHGEGHFVCLLQKGEKKIEHEPQEKHVYENGPFHISYEGEEMVMKEKHYLVPNVSATTKGLRILRSGLYLGEEKKGRFEWNPTIGTALRNDEVDERIDFAQNDERVMKYLKGETVSVPEYTGKDGYVCVTVDGYTMGLAKRSQGTLKNKYPKDWMYHG